MRQERTQAYEIVEMVWSGEMLTITYRVPGFRVQYERLFVTVDGNGQAYFS